MRHGLILTYSRMNRQTKCKSLGIVNGELVCLRSLSVPKNCENCCEVDIDDEVQEMWRRSGKCIQDRNRHSR